ncbi:MAG: tetratricopeptide repeat protein [Bacteroidia bacterium]
MLKLRYILVFLLGFIIENSFSQDYHARDSMLQIAESKHDTLKIKALNNIASFYSRIDLDSVLSYSKEALDSSKKINYKRGMAQAYSNIGMVYNGKGDYSQATKNFFLCIKLREETNDKKGLAIVYSRIADVFMKSHKVDVAIQYERKSLKLSTELKSQSGLAFSYNNLGNMYLQQKMMDSCLIYFEKSLKIKKTLNDPGTVATTLGNMSSAYVIKGQLKEALKYILDAIKILEDNNLKHNLSGNYHNLGTIYTELKNYKAAAIYLNKSMELDLKTRAKAKLAEDYLQLSFLHEKMQDYKNALEYNRKYTEMRDSVLNEDSNQQLAEMETKYQTDKKEKENLLLQTQNQLSRETIRQQNIMSYFTIGGFIIVSIAGLFVYRSYRQKQKANIEILAQKQTIELKQKEILDSIRYAKRIQQSLLPTEKYIDKNINGSVKNNL